MSKTIQRSCIQNIYYSGHCSLHNCSTLMQVCAKYLVICWLFICYCMVTLEKTWLHSTVKHRTISDKVLHVSSSTEKQLQIQYQLPIYETYETGLSISELPWPILNERQTWHIMLTYLGTCFIVAYSQFSWLMEEKVCH